MPSSRTCVRYAIYTRQSTAPERSLSSCDVQFEACRDFAEARSGPAWEWVGKRFDDIGESGADTQRPAFQQLIGHVQAGAIQKIIVYRLDRLTRNLRDSLEILKTCGENDVELLIVTAPDLGAAATDELLLNILASFAEFEREIIGSRIADKREVMKKQGRRIAGVVPFGFKTDADKQLISNQEEAQKVEAFFQLAADGMLPSDIAETANNLGWTTRAATSKSRQQRGGNLWTPRQILSVLRNPVYVGLFSDKDDVRKGRHRPLVSAELFQRAQAQIDARSPDRKARQSNPYSWPLKGKLLCSRCGRIMSPHYSQRGNIRYPHYRCRSYAGGRPPCKGSAFPAYQIESAVVDTIDSIDFEDYQDLSYNEHHLMERFSIVWELIDSHLKRHTLPKIVERVQFDEEDSNLQVSLDKNGLFDLVEQCSEHDT